ncbi:MAG: ferric iron reductase, partial [Bdellovibrionales bacterium]
VHPESVGFYEKLIQKAQVGPEFWAQSTASSRTLLVSPKTHPQMFFFAKLSLDKEVAGVVRTIPRGEVARSLGVTQILDTIGKELPKGFHYLPEVFGLMPHGMDRGGMIIREIPEAILNGQMDVMPVFSMFTKQQDGTIPMLTMSASEKQPLSSWLQQRFLNPFSQMYWDWTLRHHLAIEAHAQNFLMVIKDGQPNGEFVFRDFGGFNFNLQSRVRLGLPLPESLPILTNLENDYHQKFYKDAVKDGIKTFFEGGVLYGISKVSEHMDQKMSYQDLKNLFRSTLSVQAKKFGVKFSPFDENYLFLDQVTNEDSVVHSNQTLQKSCRSKVAR